MSKSNDDYLNNLVPGLAKLLRSAKTDGEKMAVVGTALK